MADVTMSIDAKLAPALRGFTKMLERVRTTEGGFKKLTQAAGTATRQIERTGKTGTSSFGQMRGVLDSMKGALLGIAGPGAALAMINQSYQTWLNNAREISSEVRKAADEMIAFAALQEGGAKAERVKRSYALMAQYGILERGTGINIIQSIQSKIAGEHPELTQAEVFERTLKQAEPVFGAAQMGVPLEAAGELEKVGAGLGLPGGQILRQAYIAGQLSLRDPALLAKAGPGLSFFDDMEFAMAAGAQLAAVKGEELPTYLKAAGVGLSGVSGLAEFWKEQGLEGATRQQRLQALAAGGYDSPEKLGALGLGEIRQQEAISLLVPKIAEIDSLMRGIREQAVPGVFVKQRAEVEKELPGMVAERRARILESKFKDEAVFGAQAERMTDEEYQQQLRGLALRRLGVEGALGRDVITPEGRSTKLDEALVVLKDILTLAPMRHAIREGVWAAADREGEAPATSNFKRMLTEMEKLNSQVSQLVDNTRGPIGEQPEAEGSK